MRCLTGGMSIPRDALADALSTGKMPIPRMRFLTGKMPIPRVALAGKVPISWDKLAAGDFWKWCQKSL